MSVTDPCSVVCSACGTEHHTDAGGEHCRECAAFLPEATDEQHRLLGKRMEQQIRHEQGYITVGGYVEAIHGESDDSAENEVQ